MATGEANDPLDDLIRLQEHLPELARTILVAVDGEFAEKGWASALLDARFFKEGSGQITKLRVELLDGAVGSVWLPPEASGLLSTLAGLRAKGADRWYGLRLRVTAKGECETSFDYDPQGAEDESFFKTRS
jgi:hypothetical protein